MMLIPVSQNKGSNMASLFLRYYTIICLDREGKSTLSPRQPWNGIKPVKAPSPVINTRFDIFTVVKIQVKVCWVDTM